MAGKVIVDAHPYIDEGYDEPGIRDTVISMIEDEKHRYRPSKNYLERFPSLNTSAFETELMQTEFNRLQKRKETMSMKLHELPLPPAGRITDISAWNECLVNSIAQLEHQVTRITNLELMTDYGTETWNSYLKVLEQCVAAAQTQVAKLKKQIREVNSFQENMQMQAGETLRDLEANWVELASKNYEIELTCALLEKQIKAYELVHPEKMEFD